MIMRRSWIRPFATLSLIGATACSQGPVLRGKVSGLEKITHQAERNGAMRCAPRELALAKAHLAFASLELDQGFTSRAEQHLTIAEPNAQAAYELSPPERCVERGFVLAPQPGDRDGDGFLDPEDQCPDEPETWNGFQDDDGCPDDPDTDGDGIPDSRDLCVLEPEDFDGYQDEDGCPDLDNDLDGIPDSEDKCPNDPEDFDGFQDADGCPEPDNDQDSVLDFDDHCPNEPGPPGGERPGCPTKPSLVVVTEKEIRITQQIHFQFNKDVIRKESYPILDAVVDVLQKNPSIKLEVQGHTDNKGAASYNLKLSDRRAAAVRKYLASHGVDPNRLVSKGYGMTRPLVPNDTEANRSLNRRVQFIRIEGQ